MMVQQIGQAFTKYLERNGDPDLGKITIINGGFAPEATIEPGDHTCYWWYSFGPYDDQPGEFHNKYLDPNLDVNIDFVLCGSKRIQKEAEQLGYKTLYFPIGMYGFYDLRFDRRGYGYAGSKNHKKDEKVEDLMGPYMDKPEFEWVSDFTTSTELNHWYNTRFITFGLTKEGQRKWGVVNSRVFEALGSATPFIIRDHPTLNDVLGFDYPYQVSNRSEVKKYINQWHKNPEDTLIEFREYANKIKKYHSYTVRLDHLFSTLS